MLYKVVQTFESRVEEFLGLKDRGSGPDLMSQGTVKELNICQLFWQSSDNFDAVANIL